VGLSLSIYESMFCASSDQPTYQANYDRMATVARITQSNSDKGNSDKGNSDKGNSDKGNSQPGHWIVDNLPSSRYPLYTRANIGEVFPDVVTPFSWTLWGIPHAEPGWRQALVNLGAFDADEFTANQMEVLGVFGGYGYLNASVSRIFGARTPGLGAHAIDASFFGEQPDVLPYVPAPSDTTERHAQAMAKTLAWLFSLPDLSVLTEVGNELKALRRARPDYRVMSDADLLAHVQALCAGHWEALWVRHIMATYHATIPAGLIGALCLQAGKPELAADIYGGSSDIVSALPAKSLWAISRQVRMNPALVQAFDEGLDGVLERAGLAFAQTFAQFIDDFGFRGPKEWEMRSRCWELDLKTPLAAIDRMRKAMDIESPSARMAARLAARAQAIVAIEEKLQGDEQACAQFQAAIRVAGHFFAARERTKTNIAMLIHEMRMAMWALGARFVARGHFTTADQFALLTVAEWQRALEDPGFVSNLVQQRQQQEALLSRLEPPFIIHKQVPERASWRARVMAPQNAGVGSVLQGQPGCAGVVQGIARIIADPSDPKDLEPGDILIAEHTDPSWTPLFSAAGGVVVNVGATVSHAVIVARELGVPCIVSVTGATQSIPHGALVEFDGGRGTVTIMVLNS
jgi:rifampicin phosphotransferase